MAKIHIIYKVLDVPGGSLGFLNHQQYPTKWETENYRLKSVGRKWGNLLVEGISLDTKKTRGASNVL